MRRALGFASTLFLTAVLVTSALSWVPNIRADEPVLSLQSYLEPTGATPGAWGKARFQFGHGSQRLRIEAHGLDAGVYDILVAGGAVASGEIPEGALGSDAGVFVLDSRSAGRVLFDPRGATVEVVNRLTGMTELSVDTFPRDKREELRRSRIEAEFTGTDVQPAASGSAVLRSFKGRSRFVVKVAGLAPGTYDLVLGGSPEGQLHVRSLDEIELTFDTIPAEALESGDAHGRAPRADEPQGGDEDDEGLRRLLTFDPRGWAISVARDGVDILVIDPFPPS